MTHYHIDDAARNACEVQIRIDQGDYLVERGNNDWGRGDAGRCTTYGSVADAIAAIEHLQVGGLVRAIESAEVAQSCGGPTAAEIAAMDAQGPLDYRSSARW